MLNEANYDLGRPQRAAGDGTPPRSRMDLQCRRRRFAALGAVGAVPPSLGVVEGGEIPYKPEALKQKQENQANWLTRDPEIKCYLPGVPRATYMPQPFRILQSAEPDLHRLPVCRRGPQYLPSRIPDRPRWIVWMGQSVGHWEARRWWST